MSESSFSSMSDLEVTEDVHASVVHQSCLNEELSQMSKVLIAPQVPAQEEKPASKFKVQPSSIRKIMKMMKSPNKPPYLDLTKSPRGLYPNISVYSTAEFNKEKYETSFAALVPQSDSQSSCKENIIERNRRSLQEFGKLMKREQEPAAASPRTGSRDPVAVQERFYSFERRKTEKLEDERRRQYEEEAKGFTFKPAINKGLHTEHCRRPEEYYRDMMKKEKLTQEKIGRMRNDRAEELKDKEQCRFKPVICRKSEKILANKPYANESCYERLYNMHKPFQRETLSSSCSSEDLSRDSDNTSKSSFFIPKVNKYSRELIRNKRIDKRLYEDAMRRMAVTPQPLQRPPQPATHLTRQSMKILIRQFINEFKRKSQEHDLEGDRQINYSRFVSMFRAMNFISERPKLKTEESVSLYQIWNRLAGDSEKIRLNDLGVIMLGIMGYYKPWMSDANSQLFTISEKETHSLHERFKGLFEHRGISSMAKANTREKEELPLSANTSMSNSKSQREVPGIKLTMVNRSFQPRARKAPFDKNSQSTLDFKSPEQQHSPDETLKPTPVADTIRRVKNKKKFLESHSSSGSEGKNEIPSIAVSDVYFETDSIDKDARFLLEKPMESPRNLLFLPELGDYVSEPCSDNLSESLEDREYLISAVNINNTKTGNILRIQTTTKTHLR